MDDKRAVLKVLWFTPGRRGRWGLPACFWGPPGVGKTTELEHAARAFGLSHVETLSPGERGEGAFGVVPMPTPDGKRLLYPAPDWTEHFADDAAALVFVDEINRAAPAIQPPLLGLVNELRIAGIYLGSRARCVAAANPSESAPGVYEMDPAEGNRMGHFDWPAPSVEDFTKWALGGCNGGGESEPLDAEAEEARVMKLWPAAFAGAVGRVTAFLRAYPSLLHRQPPEGDPARGRAWPSPRSWELAMRALAGCDVHGLSEEDTDMVLAAFVGAPAASQYADWLAKANLPDPVQVLDGKGFTHDPDRLDRTVAVLASCAALVAPKNAEKRAARAARLWGLIGEVAKATPDITEPAATAMVDGGLQTMKEAIPVLAKLFPVLKSGRQG
jgi:MoxR-like ATPase